MTDYRSFEATGQTMRRKTSDTDVNVPPKAQNNAVEGETGREHSIRELIGDFCDYTSAHGLGRVHGSKHIFRKVVWSLIFIGALVVFSLQIASLFAKFRAKPLSTFIRLQHDTSLPFPTVTFCNFNPIRQSWIDQGPDIVREGFKNTSDVSIDDWQDQDYDEGSGQRRRREAAQDDSELGDGDSRNGDYGSGYYGDDDYYYGDEDGFEDPDDLDQGYVAEEHMTMVLALATPEDLQPLGHQFENMVLSCTYRGVPCRNYTKKFWTSFWHYKYGNCFVFNSGKHLFNRTGVNLKSNKAGPSHGLNLELNIEQSEYIGSFTEEAGIRVAISNSGEMPFPLEQGLSVSPGFATSIGLRKVSIYREDPFKNGSCLRDSSMGTGNLYRRVFNASYTSMACKESCLAYNQRKECGCMEYRFPITKGRICNVLNATTAKCLSKVQIAFKENKLNCSKTCQEPCKQEIFKQASTFAVWPSEEHEPYFKNADKVDDWSDFRSNVLKLSIFYEELNFEVIEEQLAYELVNFASDVGGQLGLWIGFSVLTLAEFLELLLLICHTICRKVSRKFRQNKTADLKDGTELGQYHKD